MKIVLTKTLGDLLRRGQCLDLPSQTISMLEAQTGMRREQFLRLADQALSEVEEAMIENAE